MKKTLALLLVAVLLSAVCLTGCDIIYLFTGESVLYEVVNSSKPTRVTTDVAYSTNAGDKLSGFYVTSINGNDTVFTYEYQKLSTPEESLENGTDERIVTLSGTISYKDGVYSGDTEDWKPGVGTAFDLRFNIDKDLLDNVDINGDDTVLVATVSPENAVKVIGTDLGAVGDISITVETNAVKLTMVTLSCSTVNGTMTIRTSYTYNEQDLFPDEQK